MTALLVGLVLALGVGVFARAAGLDRDRSFYPTVLIIVGAFYILFAAMADPAALWREAALMAAFVALAVAGLKTTQWLLVLGLAGHGALDLVHHHVSPNAGVPDWWPAFCGGFDIAFAGWLAMQLLSRKPAAG
jgi:hypothetical protein